MSKKSKKLIRQLAAQPDAPAAAPGGPDDVDAAADPYAAFAGRDWGFRFLPDAPAEPVDEKALHLLMKEWRHGRASRTIGQVLGDAYFMIFSLVVLGAMVVNLLLNSNQHAAGCTTDACLAGRTLLPWAVLFAVATLTLAVARIFGPVLASAAEGFWLMDAPISRTRLLGGRLRGVVLGAFLVAGASAALLALLAGAAPLGVTGWALGTGAAASGLMALAAFEQSRERRVVVRGLQIVFGTAAAAAVVWMVLVAAGRAPLLDALPTAAPWLVAGAGGVLAAVFGVAAFRRLNQIRRARLLSGGSLVSGMQGAMFALDLGLARDILVEREAVERGHVRPTKGRGLGLRALIWRDAQRVVRFPKPLLGLVAAALVPYALDALGIALLLPLVASLGLAAALVPFLGSLRVLTRTGGLARSFPFPTRDLRNALMVVPTLLAAAWMGVAFPAVAGVAGGVQRAAPDALAVTFAIGVAGLLGAVRWQTAKQVDFNTPMVATNAGALPPALIFNLFRGLDVCLLVTAPLMFGAPVYVSIGLALVVYFFLGVDMGELQEEAKEQQRIAAAEKAAAKGTAEKIRISRPKR
nr:ABC transporter permease [Propionibacterium sp.]